MMMMMMMSFWELCVGEAFPVSGGRTGGESSPGRHDYGTRVGLGRARASRDSFGDYADGGWCVHDCRGL
ncbi:hypothetical protein A2U01_0036613 [Trifolium medium]|uniref:Secreted protein n=1 Tax=Trifolium medium TaxID=97028 RepID=A0A392PX02_9FABA|nr:hypothetical protein [Trifolium medium]